MQGNTPKEVLYPTGEQNPLAKVKNDTQISAGGEANSKVAIGFCTNQEDIAGTAVKTS